MPSVSLSPALTLADGGRSNLETVIARYDRPPINDTLRGFIDWVARYTLSPLLRGRVLQVDQLALRGVVRDFQGGDAARLRALLASVAAQDYAPLEVIVLANGCAETSALVRAEHPAVRLVELPENIGCAPGRNRIAVRVDAPTETPGTVWSLRKRQIKGVLNHHDTRPGGAWTMRGQEAGSGGISAFLVDRGTPGFNVLLRHRVNVLVGHSVEAWQSLATTLGTAFTGQADQAHGAQCPKAPG